MNPCRGGTVLYKIMIVEDDAVIAGSVAVLKFLKGRKKYYYKTRHFISVSGLLYRMKQNAAGLATICILSTSAIIVLSAGAALYANGERSINLQNPRMIQITSSNRYNDSGTVLAALEDVEKTEGVELSNKVVCQYGSRMFEKNEKGLFVNEEQWFSGFDKNPDAYVMTLEEYNRFHQTNATLAKDEILLYASDDFYTLNTLEFEGITYHVKGIAKHDCFTYITDPSMSLFAKMLIVVPDEETFQRFIPTEDERAMKRAISVSYIGFDVSEKELADSFVDALRTSFMEKEIDSDITYKAEEEDIYFSMYGGIMFLGLVLGILFILSTGMIIYYKQISEGYDDRQRFTIMQKVGLSKKEIKDSIHSQIMLVFFLPLVTAVLHAAVALKIVASCLECIVIVHFPTFLLSVAITCIIFTMVYIVVYKLTSREYYNIVNE